MRVFLGDQSVEITEVFHLVFEEANLRVRGVSSSCGSPRQASVIACVVLAGTKERLGSPKEF